MKNKSLVFLLLMITVVSSVFRVFPYEARPVWLGAPQIALAIFAGAYVGRRGLSFLVVLLSMLLSDVLIHLVHLAYPTMAPGFYSGQMLNYCLIGGLTAIGFLVKPGKWQSVLAGLISGPIAYFLVSNFIVWIGGGGYQRPITPAGLLQCYIDGLPFLRSSLIGTLLFGGVLFGVFSLLTKGSKQVAAA